MVSTEQVSDINHYFRINTGVRFSVLELAGKHVRRGTSSELINISLLFSVLVRQAPAREVLGCKHVKLFFSCENDDEKVSACEERWFFFCFSFTRVRSFSLTFRVYVIRNGNDDIRAGVWGTRCRCGSGWWKAPKQHALNGGHFTSSIVKINIQP